MRVKEESQCQGEESLSTSTKDLFRTALVLANLRPSIPFHSTHPRLMLYTKALPPLPLAFTLPPSQPSKKTSAILSQPLSNT